MADSAEIGDTSAFGFKSINHKVCFSWSSCISKLARAAPLNSHAFFLISWICFPVTCHCLLSIHPWVTDTHISGRWNLPWLPPSPPGPAWEPANTEIWARHRLRELSPSFLSSSYRHSAWAPSASRRSAEQEPRREPSCPLGAQLGVPEYQTQLHSNVSTKSHFGSHTNDSSGHVVSPPLLRLSISSDNRAMTTCPEMIMWLTVHLPILLLSTCIRGLFPIGHYHHHLQAQATQAAVSVRSRDKLLLHLVTSASFYHCWPVGTLSAFINKK